MPPPTRILSAPLISQKLRIHPLLVAITFASCVLGGAGAGRAHSLTRDEAAAVDRAVRTVMQTVSLSVTQDGPPGLDEVLRWESHILYGRERPIFQLDRWCAECSCYLDQGDIDTPTGYL
jgi:hypothetical protein